MKHVLRGGMKASGDLPGSLGGNQKRISMPPRGTYLMPGIIAACAALAGVLVWGAVSAGRYSRLLDYKREIFSEEHYNSASFLPAASDTAAENTIIFSGGIKLAANPALGTALLDFNFNSPAAGVYCLAAEYESQNANYETNRLDLWVNGEEPGIDQTNLVLPSFYRFVDYNFKKISGAMTSIRIRKCFRTGSRSG